MCGRPQPGPVSAGAERVEDPMVLDSSISFAALTKFLATFLTDKGEFTVASGQIDSAPDLKTLVERLPLKTLALTGATIAPPAGDGKWVLTGAPASRWPVPGFDDLFVEMPGAIVTLTVSDEAADPDGAATLDLQLAGDMNIATGQAVALVLDMQPLSSATTIGTPEHRIPLDNVLGHIKASTPAWLGLRALLPPGLDFGLVSASFTTAFQPDQPEAAPRTSRIIVGTVTLPGKFTMQVEIETEPEKDAEPNITLSWPVEGQPEPSGSLSNVLHALGLPFGLPGPLDRPLGSFAISVMYIDEANRLNAKDVHRLVLSIPNQPEPDFRLCRSLDDRGEERNVLRGNWDDVTLPKLPLVGDHLEVRLSPLILLLSTGPLTIKEAAVLSDVLDLADMLDVSEDDAEKTPFAAGIRFVGTIGFPLDGDSPVPGVDVSLDSRRFNLTLYTADDPPPSTVGDQLTTSGADALQPSNKTSKVPLQRNVGPVYIEDVGFRFENDEVSFLLDIALNSGGLTFELLGLRAGLALKDHSLSVGLDGFVLSFSSGEVSLTGGFKRDTSGASADYIGTALLRVGQAFALEVLGAFSDGSPPKMFIFGVSSEQLGGPPWLFITGLAAGIGYNRAFTVPAVEHVNDFPLVQIANNLSRGEPSPVKNGDAEAVWSVLNSVEQYLGPSNGANFVTAGFTAKSFGIVDSTVLAAITFGSDVGFVLLGSSSVSIPKDAPIVRADIEVVASVQQDAGLIAIDGLLAPGSYVLSPDCHLTGGFASHSWFAGQHAGDFVLTLGGYAPGYPRPSHYPAVPRLGYIWKISDEVMITGWSYFALTPSMLQAGGGLSVVLEAGPLRAWCNVTADLSAQWRPFHYDVTLHVDFGVSFEMHLLFCSVTLTVDITADLAIWGPPLTGHADVSLWFVSFGVDFGAHAPRGPHAESWSESSFIQDLVVPTSRPAPRALASARTGHLGATPSTSQPLQIVALNGLAAAPTGAAFDWTADPAKTALSIATALPAAKATLNGKAIDGVPAISLQAKAISGAPTIDPTLAISITSQEAVDAWHASPDVGAVPSALWQATSATELTPALTTVRLDIVPQRPDQSLPIEQNALLFHDVRDFPLAWERPSVPAAGGFNWADDNPFKTIRTAAAQRAALLGAMAEAGYLDQASIAGIDVDLVVAAQPCFMSDPVLCRLGTEQLS